MITGNIIADNANGIEIRYSDNNQILENNIENNTKYGIQMTISDFNTISKNNITDNEIGIYLDTSNYNSITENIFIGNEQCIVEVNFIGNNIQNNFCSNEVIIWIWIGIIVGIISLTIIIILNFTS